MFGVIGRKTPPLIPITATLRTNPIPAARFAKRHPFNESVMLPPGLVIADEGRA